MTQNLPLKFDTSLTKTDPFILHRSTQFAVIRRCCRYGLNKHAGDLGMGHPLFISRSEKDICSYLLYLSRALRDKYR